MEPKQLIFHVFCWSSRTRAHNAHVRGVIKKEEYERVTAVVFKPGRKTADTKNRSRQVGIPFPSLKPIADETYVLGVQGRYKPVESLVA